MEPPRWPEWSGVCDPDPFSLNPQTECGIHSSVMLAIYILAEERTERRREHFQFVIRRFPKKKRGKEKEYFIFAASLGTTLWSGERGEQPRISFRRRRQATKTYKSGQMKRETGREYRMDRGAGRSKGALAELLSPPFGAHETSSTRLGVLRPPL